jgi:hypothetical protein
MAYHQVPCSALNGWLQKLEKGWPWKTTEKEGSVQLTSLCQLVQTSRFLILLTFQRGRLSTVDLLKPTSSDQLLLILKTFRRGRFSTVDLLVLSSSAKLLLILKTFRRGRLSTMDFLILTSLVFRPSCFEWWKYFERGGGEAQYYWPPCTY